MKQVIAQNGKSRMTVQALKEKVTNLQTDMDMAMQKKDFQKCQSLQQELDCKNEELSRRDLSMEDATKRGLQLQVSLRFRFKRLFLFFSHTLS